MELQIITVLLISAEVIMFGSLMVSIMLLANILHKLLTGTLGIMCIFDKVDKDDLKLHGKIAFMYYIVTTIELYLIYN